MRVAVAVWARCIAARPVRAHGMRYHQPSNHQRVPCAGCWLTVVENSLIKKPNFAVYRALWSSNKRCLRSAAMAQSRNFRATSEEGPRHPARDTIVCRPGTGPRVISDKLSVVLRKIRTVFSELFDDCRRRSRSSTFIQHVQV